MLHLLLSVHQYCAIAKLLVFLASRAHKVMFADAQLKVQAVCSSAAGLIASHWKAENPQISPALMLGILAPADPAL